MTNTLSIRQIRLFGGLAALTASLFLLSSCETIGTLPPVDPNFPDTGPIFPGDEDEDADLSETDEDAGGELLSITELLEEADLYTNDEEVLQASLIASLSGAEQEFETQPDTEQDWNEVTTEGFPKAWFEPDPDDGPEPPENFDLEDIPADEVGEGTFDNIEEEERPRFDLENILGSIFGPTREPEDIFGDFGDLILDPKNPITDDDAFALSAASISRPKRPRTGATKTVSKPIFVPKGKTFNGKHKNGAYTRYKAHPKKLGDGSQSENQRPIFVLQGGAKLKNIIIDKSGADGIRVVLSGKSSKTYINNVEFRDVGEDAISVKHGNSRSSVYIKDCQFYKAADKVIQINTSARVYIQNCYFEDFKRAVRACGTCGNHSYRVYVESARARKGKSLLKMSNSKARGSVKNSKVKDVDAIANQSGGAKISTKSNKSYR